MADEITTTAPAVTSQKGALVGDDNVASPVDVAPRVYATEAPAQVTATREPDSDTVQVHEVAVATDKVITDPSSPEAVQIPDAGRGSLDLPIHALANGTPEEVFAAAAKKSSPKK